MRSAGCIVNDVLDRKFDKKVLRTKSRPIASGKISVLTALVYASILCFLALLVLINFNYFTIFLAFASMPLAFTYPLMKRYTYWPQLFLGITFNYGLVLGWTSIKDEIDILPIIFYLGAIFWTLGYDTIYGYQDIKDDEIIGVKSTSIKFKQIPKVFLSMVYSLFFLSLIFVGYYMDLDYVFFIILILIFYQLFFYQIKSFKKNKSKLCLRIFKSNNLLGFMVFINIIVGKLL
tara:strand:- start:390 stop:1088 length:699 start_codon:yes stop_codon:yes gene_type:complete